MTYDYILLSFTDLGFQTQEEIRDLLFQRIKGDDDKIDELKERAQEDKDTYELEASLDDILELLIDEEVESLLGNVQGKINF